MKKRSDVRGTGRNGAALAAHRLGPFALAAGLVLSFTVVGLFVATIGYEGATVEHMAHSTWAALLQHECDRLDGVLYPMRMDDLSTLAFNEAPGALAEEAAKNPDQVDPLFLDLVGRWPARERWCRSAV